MAAEGVDDHCQIPRGGKGNVSLAHMAGMVRSRQIDGEISGEDWRQIGGERRGLLLEVKGRRLSDREFGGLEGRAEIRQIGRK